MEMLWGSFSQKEEMIMEEEVLQTTMEEDPAIPHPVLQAPAQEEDHPIVQVTQVGRQIPEVHLIQAVVLPLQTQILEAQTLQEIH